MAAQVFRQPSGRFLATGVPTDGDARAIETLARRRDHLKEELDGPEYRGDSYDRRELASLAWALSLVALVKKAGGVPQQVAD